MIFNMRSFQKQNLATPHLPSGHPLPLMGEELKAAVVCPLSPQGERVGVRGGGVRPGFTLIEAFVAISILVMAMVGPLAIASQSATLAAFTRDQVTANFLAQDAVEYIRWIRDSNQLSGNDWMSRLSNCISSSGGSACYFDSSLTSPSIQSCASGGCPALLYDTTTGRYDYDAGVASHFTRTVSMVSPVAPNDCTTGKGCEVSLTVKVSWKTGTLPHSVTVKENLMRWAGS